MVVCLFAQCMPECTVTSNAAQAAYDFGEKRVHLLSYLELVYTIKLFFLSNCSEFHATDSNPRVNTLTLYDCKLVQYICL